MYGLIGSPIPLEAGAPKRRVAFKNRPPVQDNLEDLQPVDLHDHSDVPRCRFP
jgi:hypothetical protein